MSTVFVLRPLDQNPPSSIAAGSSVFHLGLVCAPSTDFPSFATLHLSSVEEANKNMYAFSTTTYTGFQCTVSEETSEKFKELPGVLWVLPDSYINVRNKDYGGDKYINGEIIPCKHPTYQPTHRGPSKYESKRYERRKSGPPPKWEPTQAAAAAESESNSK